ncbi:rhomboid family intramembrane serine protease [Sphingomonas sp. BIUV-7]|uniref:Rhomboid family intramembrane serine protease n=1 Tax=Sphingomonas natans TaxID=3063330 RepID=A0ABT8Y3K7_9SPHN|nr:rhomboid family intramembrane serine protease [Sphingomonas sp. BIUV-7]MDO6412896.1 rhomboid family intramembrane serine protease [Sphingomonas sp. BIUV-7]
MRSQPPRATLMLGVGIAAAFVLFGVAGQSDTGALLGGFIPARIGGPPMPDALPVWLTPLSATMLHGGILHLVFNLMMLGYCGKETEVALGPAALCLLYVVGAYAAAAAQFIADPHATIPMIGASGAISAIVGAYAILYGQRRASTLPPNVARWVHIAWLAAAWTGLQLLVGFASRLDGMAIAAAAHIGGFLAGLVMARPLLRFRYRQA